VRHLPSREETYHLVQNIIDAQLQRYGRNLQNAWKAVYAALLWYEPVGSGRSLPHIIDADKLWRPKFKQRGIADPNPSRWYRRASAVNHALAIAFSCKPYEVPEYVDKLMKSRRYRGMQRQNPLGAGFIGAVAHILRRFGDSALRHELEVSANTIFPGIGLPGRTRAPSIDIVSIRKRNVVAITSCKWSLRHDRIGDISTECPAYKQAAYRVGRQKIKYFVITNEFDPARLSKLLDDECIDASVHVHKPLITETCGLNRRLRNLWDFTDYVNSSTTW